MVSEFSAFFSIVNQYVTKKMQFSFLESVVFPLSVLYVEKYVL